MPDKLTAADIEADDAALADETDAIIAMIEGGAGDVLAVLDAMAAALEPGDDPRLSLGLAALRRIWGAG